MGQQVQTIIKNIKTNVIFGFAGGPNELVSATRILVSDVKDGGKRSLRRYEVSKLKCFSIVYLHILS